MNLGKVTTSILMAAAVLFIGSQAFANKSSVEISAPVAVKKGSTVTIKITVSHKGNNFMHYTNWAYINVNGKEAARWDFSSGKRPENEVFTREITYAANAPLVIEAEANCNIHGSAGKKSAKVAVK